MIMDRREEASHAFLSEPNPKEYLDPKVSFEDLRFKVAVSVVLSGLQERFPFIVWQLSKQKWLDKDLVEHGACPAKLQVGNF